MGVYSFDVASTITPEDKSPNAQHKVILADTPWSDAWALDRVRQDFNLAENYRTMNHDWRWRNADELYLAWMTQKYWEGTRVPRSSIGIYVALQQIESILPKLLSTLFAEGARWFQVAPRPNTTMEEAHAVQDLLLYHLDGDHTRPHERVREVFRRAIKSACIYGNGIVEIGWRNSVLTRRRVVRRLIPQKTSLDLSFLGAGSLSVPTGKFKIDAKEEKYVEKINLPFVNWVSLKDFYIDPNCPSPNIQEARYVFKRAFMAIDDVLALGNQPFFKIPDKATLVDYSHKKPFAQADWTKAGTEIVRTGYWYPNIDMTSDPAGKRVEILAYWTKDRLVWMLARDKVILNITNPYGFIPFYDAYYTDVLDRFYGLAITDIVEGEQRLIQSIVNARVDELALSIHKPMIKRRGLTVPSYQLRRRPGQVIEAEDPKTDIQMEEPANVTAQAFVEVDAAERRVQKYTGISDLAVLGAPSSGGNAASRTATGVNTQAQASFSRVQYILENIEDTFVEPILAGIHTLEQRFLDPNTPVQILGEEGQTINIDPLSVMNASVKFDMRASAKLQSRTMLMQIFPLVAQTFLNPEFLQMLATQQNKTVNIDEIANMLIDATSYPSRTALFRPLSQQEQQMMKQPTPDMMVKAQIAQQRGQDQQQVADTKGTYDITKAVIQHVPKYLSEQEGGEEEKSKE